ncbi:MAG: CPBP family glutamic-type intramembrane protease [Candidatus Brocadiaceae bacterium]
MRQYFHRSKSLANSFLFIMPLLVLYEMGIVMYGSPIKNTADVIIKTPLTLFGRNSSLIFNSIVIVSLLASIFFIEKEHALSVMIFLWMFLESIGYALLLGYGVGFIVYKVFFTHALASPFLSETGLGIILSIGAGVYEEIVFRFLLLLFLYNFIFTKLLKISKPLGAAISVFLAALIFTSLHYMSSSGDSFTYASFTFRFLSGLFLSALYMFRGLGIAVYTHAIYDVMTVLKPFQV